MLFQDVFQKLVHQNLSEVALATLLLLTTLLLPYLYNSSRTFRYHSRFVFYVAAVSLAAIGCIPAFALNPMNVKNCMYISTVLKPISKLFGIKWELRGREILAEDKGFVIVANHQTMVDILGMFDIWHVMDKCAAIARKEVFYVWPFGLAAWLAGVVFIDRSNPKRALSQMVETTNLMRNKRVKVWVFPEGTRNKEHSLLPFKKGAFHLAVSAQVPIVPVVYSPYYFLNAKKKYFGSGRVIITALPPIPTQGLTADDIPDLMERTRNAMITCYEAVAKELRAILPPNYPGLDSN